MPTNEKNSENFDAKARGEEAALNALKTSNDVLWLRDEEKLRGPELAEAQGWNSIVVGEENRSRWGSN